MGITRQRVSAAGWLGGLAGVILLLATAGPAHAVLISADWKSYGDGLLTRDTETGLEWLDLTYTAGMSYMDVKGQLLDKHSELYGFQYAINSAGNYETDFIWHGLGREPGEFFESPEELYNPVLDFMSLIGITRPPELAGDGWGTMGMDHDVGDEAYETCLSLPCTTFGEPGTVDSASVAYLIIYDYQNWGRIETNYTSQPLGLRSPIVGSMIYRASKVPEAPTAMLMGLGLLCVGLTAMRLGSSANRG